MERRMKAIGTRSFARGALQVSELGMGSAPLGGLYRAVTTAEAMQALQAAWEIGVRYFDTAPMYGLGRSEHLVGDLLRGIEEETGRQDWVLSSKVGRLMRNARPGAPLPPPLPRNEFDSGWQSGLSFTEVFDYSYDGVMRSYEDSQQRLGLSRIDILYVHDIGRATHGERHDRQWNELLTGGFKALGELRADGYIRAVGLGVNEWQAIREALDVFDLDCCLLAGRYTLLDQSALPDLLATCTARKVSVVMAGVFNSGILVSGGDQKFNYIDAPAEILERVARLKSLCDRFAIPLAAAALQFPLAHPAAASVVVGARSAAEIRQTAGWFHQPISGEFWAALRESGLIDAAAPLPAGA
jgi:D-threo-aldose 1-dehydrogenase